MNMKSTIDAMKNLVSAWDDIQSFDELLKMYKFVRHIESLRDSIKREEAQSVEPVAWQHKDGNDVWVSNGPSGSFNPTPLFTHPEVQSINPVAYLLIPGVDGDEYIDDFQIDIIQLEAEKLQISLTEKLHDGNVRVALFTNHSQTDASFPMTPSEIMQCWMKANGAVEGVVEKFARAIESHHGINS